MKLNKRGITLVEIIISIALISIVLIFLFSLLVDVKDMNDEADLNSTYLINKSLMLKNIEEDLDKVNSLTLNTCQINDFYTAYNTYWDGLEDKQKAKECIKFTFDDNTNGFLGIYYYQDKSSYVISYIHGNKKATRLLPEFDKYNVDDNENIKSGFEIKYSNSDGTTNEIITSEKILGKNIFHKIEIPIIGSDGKDYSILISYYKKN